MRLYVVPPADNRRSRTPPIDTRRTPLIISAYLADVYLMDVCLMGMHLVGVDLTGVYLIGVHLIYESSSRAGHGWRESLYRHQGCFKASDCGRLGRQAAGHPWSALRVAKSCRKDCPTASVLPKPKQELCIQSGTRVHYLNYLHRRWARRGKEAQAIGLAIR